MNKEEFTSLLTKGYTYVFELCTSFNIVVTPHKESKIILLTIRDLEHKYNSFLMVLEKLYFEIKIWKHQSETQKDFALKVQAELTEDLRFLQPFAYQVGAGKVTN